MHVTTFYSFKGGVGRSMALANVAFQLSRAGRRVLIVDFDLEAPGIDSYAGGRSHRPAAGIVEFVLAYLGDDEPPDVRDYIYEDASLGDGANPVFVMPAGGHDEHYAYRLNQIDWNNLYEEHEGYLLFEDLRAQWEKRLQVDYVLIDSRTGHTDVGGICTRQLPDSVVVLFFPNEQNLHGLQKVVADIRDEPMISGRKAIDLIFVASDVPDLDDEEDIVRRRLAAFRRGLSINTRLEVIHHYNSLALLNEPIFTRDRPRTKLAKQYRSLTRRVQSLNIDDREGVLSSLRAPLSELDSYPQFERFLNRLTAIESAHPADGEILFNVAEVRVRLGQLSEAAALYEHALQLGYATPKAYLNLAETHQSLGNPDPAWRAAVRVFSDPSGDLELLWRALELLRLLQPDAIIQIVGSPAVQMLGLGERVSLAASLDRSRLEASALIQILNPIVTRSSGDEPWYSTAIFALGLASMALGKFTQADSLFGEYASRIEPTLPVLFNRAMAAWALEGVPNTGMFQGILQRYPDSLEDNANAIQCYALIHWIVGSEDRARESLARAKHLISQQSAPEFSCWRYLRVSPDEFSRDLARMKRFFDGEGIRPSFMSDQEELLNLLQNRTD